MLTAKGREELARLMGSSLVEDWAEADRLLKGVLRLLLTQRPDLVRLYFEPEVWGRIRALGKAEAAQAILALLRAGVIVEAGAPEVSSREQAAFYLGAALPDYVGRARAWCAEHPGECPGRRPGLAPRVAAALGGPGAGPEA
jgi:hypothetical protein